MKTQKNIITLGLILIIITFSSCDEMFFDRIEGDKDLEIVDRDITNFDEIISEGNFSVYISLDENPNLEIEAESNLIPYIITEVHNKKLFIEVKDGYKLDNNKAMKIYVSISNLEEVNLNGSGNIYCDNLVADYLELNLIGSGRIDFSNMVVEELEAEILGSGKIVLSGSGTETKFELIGSGSIRALDFIHDESNSSITGSGNIYVHSKEYLKAIISGSGNIYFEGDPDIDEHISGTGDVRRY